MATENANAAVDALLDFWRRRPGLDLRARDLCGRLEQALETISSFTPAALIGVGEAEARGLVGDALREAAARDPIVRSLVAALAPAADSTPPRREPLVSTHVARPGEDGTVHVVSTVAFQPAPAQKALTILFAAADPSDGTRLRLGKEAREISDTIKRSPYRDRIAFEQMHSVRSSDLHAAVLELRPQLIHFAGHGSPDGLCFENNAGRASVVPVEALARFFSVFAGEVKCVVLNACFSEPQARAIAQHIPCVIGMSEEIADRTAIAFATGFYQAIGAGRSVADAHTLGCTLAEEMLLPGHLVPQLIERPY
jgi:hypothetical protein